MRQDTITLSDIHPRDTSEVEWQVISDLVDDNDIIPEVLNVVRPDFFTSEGRRDFYTGIVAAFNAGEPMPGYSAYVKVRPEVQTEYVAFKEMATMNQKMSSASTKDQEISHIALLRESAARRRAYYAGLQLLQLSSGNDSESELYAKATDAVQSIEDKSVKEEYTIGEVFDEIAEAVQERKREYDAGKLPGVPTGIRNLDDVIDGGFKRGNLVVIAARPSVGKTAIAIQLIRNAAKAGHKCVFFSIEMMREEIGHRMLYSTERIDSFQVWSGNMDWNGFEEAVAAMGSLPILVNDHSRNLTELVTRMTVLARQGRCDVAFVDYLGLINPTDRRIPLYQQIAEVTGTMKATAKRIGIPIVLLCQLNRDAAKEDTDPDLYHLRDSGSIEQDADVVLMLRRNGDNLDLLVRKNRHGDSNLRITLETNATRTNYTDAGIEKI